MMEIENKTDPAFRAIADSSCAMALYDTLGNQCYCNSSWLGLFGLSSGGHLLEFLHRAKATEQMKDVIVALEPLFAKPEIGSWSGSVPFKLMNGSVETLLLIVSSFRTQSGDLLGFMASIIRLHAQPEVERNTRIQEDFRLLKYFSERLAHELGTTLGVIRGRAEYFEAPKSFNAKKAKSAFALIVKQVDRASKIVNYLLSFSSNAPATARERISLEEKMQKVLEHLKIPADSDLISLNLSISPNLVVLGDQKRLFEALVSLVENGLDAIKVAPKRSDRHQITFRAYESGSRAILEVGDSGCGIPEENLIRIFQPFFTTKDIGQGVGMGLTLAARFIEDMGGTISVNSGPAGTVFKISLPLAEPA